MKRKHIGLVLAMLLSTYVANSQQRQPSPEKGAREGHKYSSGLLQDVLSNYIQVVAKNVTSSKSGVQAKFNWFALNPMDSAQKYNNDYFLRSGWQRNGEFILSAGLKDSKINTWSAGFNFNLLNRRDVTNHYYKAVYDSSYTEEGKILPVVVDNYYGPVSYLIIPVMIKVCKNLHLSGTIVNDLKLPVETAIPGIITDAATQSDLEDLRTRLNADRGVTGAEPDGLSQGTLDEIRKFSEGAAKSLISNSVDNYINASGKEPLKFPVFVNTQLKNDIFRFIEEQVQNNAFLHGKLGADDLIAVNDRVALEYDHLLKYIGRQPLLTFGYLFTHNGGNLSDVHAGGFTYLQGLGRLDAEKIGQLNISLTDSLMSTGAMTQPRKFNRNIVAFQAGYNQILALMKKVSVMELNVAVEADYATSGYITKQDRSRFYLDAYYRARLPETPWIKLDLKYDPKDGNVFGFLNFTYNID